MKTPKKPLFIAFEGIDGSGKSTQIKRLAAHLQQQGHKLHLTNEPTNGPIGKMIRDIFSHRMPGTQHTIAALFVADRMEHILNQTDGMLKMLREGYTVITDRYYFSSYAYHSVHVNMDWVIDSNREAAQLLRPDVTFYIDIAPEESMRRIAATRAQVEMYETLENQKRVYEKYEAAFARLAGTEKIIRINGAQPEDKVAGDIFSQLSMLEG